MYISPINHTNNVVTINVLLRKFSAISFCCSPKVRVKLTPCVEFQLPTLRNPDGLSSMMSSRKSVRKP